MRNSVLLQKVFLVILVTLVVTSFLTVGIYMVMSRTMFANIRASEMLPKARAVAALFEPESRT